MTRDLYYKQTNSLQNLATLGEHIQMQHIHGMMVWMKMMTACDMFSSELSSLLSVIITQTPHKHTDMHDFCQWLVWLATVSAPTRVLGPRSSRLGWVQCTVGSGSWLGAVSDVTDAFLLDTRTQMCWQHTQSPLNHLTAVSIIIWRDDPIND